MSIPPGKSGDADRETVAVLALVDTFGQALRRDDRATIVDTARQLIAMRAPLGGQWLQLAMIAAVNGEVCLARAAAGIYVESCGGDVRASFGTVDLLAQIGAWDEVAALLRQWPAQVPKPVSYAYLRGTAALYLGETDEARRHLEEAVRLHPRVGSPWLSLDLVVDFAREPDLAELVIASERSMEQAPPAERGSYYYALGKAYADRGDHSRAFAAFARGAGAMKSHIAYSREQDRAEAIEAVRGYDADGIAALARQQSEPTGRGILVTGLPRSGSTLVEQILTSHSAVSGGGEIYRLGLLAKDVRGRSYPALRSYVDGGGAPAAARLWRHWLDERFPVPGRVVDKTLDASRLLGLAAALLPEAPLIWLRRDPLDCAWSCFRTSLAGAAPWSFDLEDIAYHFRLEDELLSRWQAILGDRLLVVPYEELVTAPEQWIRHLLAHCGLAEEPQVFAPHENRRAVTTSSVTQVRRPINRAGIGAAEPYREFLEPFVAAYYR
ncbi:MAG TPA: sulfotransferase [Croceibacterium sp.]